MNKPLTVTFTGALAQAIRNGAANLDVTPDVMAAELALTTLLLMRDEQLRTVKIGGAFVTQIVCPCAEQEQS